jgi:hypothetical protein
MLDPILPRLCYLALQFAQPFLVERAIELISNPRGPNFYLNGGRLFYTKMSPTMLTEARRIDCSIWAGLYRHWSNIFRHSKRASRLLISMCTGHGFNLRGKGCSCSHSRPCRPLYPHLSAVLETGPYCGFKRLEYDNDYRRRGSSAVGHPKNA